MKFHSTVELGGKTATGIQVPEEIVTVLAGGKRPKVRVTINGYTYRSSIAPMDGKFMLPISAEHRAGAAVQAGDKIEIDIEIDNEPREVNVPADFSAALERDVEAKKFFDGLSYSNRLRLVLAIEQAKTAETRQRRIEKTVANLHEGRA
jgi:hypothetical protein